MQAEQARPEPTMTRLSASQGEWSIVAATVWEPQRAWTVSLDPLRAPMAPMLLEGSAFHIWKAAHSVSSMDELVQAMASDFGADPGALEPDVRAFVDQLANQGLLARGDQRPQGR